MNWIQKVAQMTADQFRDIMRSEHPEAAIRTMLDNGMLQQMLNLPPEYHPLNMDQMNKHHQLTLIEHTLQVIKNVNDLARKYGLDDDQRMMMNMASLFHDLGKLDERSHTTSGGGRGYSGGGDKDPDRKPHEMYSADRWMDFAQSLGLEEESDFVRKLVVHHMRPHDHFEEGSMNASEGTLSRYVRNNPEWLFQYIHAQADAMSKSEMTDEAAGLPYDLNITNLTKEIAPNAHQFGMDAPTLLQGIGKDIISIVGLPPAPPPGMDGYVKKLKEEILAMMESNPEFSRDDAIAYVHSRTDEIRQEYTVASSDTWTHHFS